MTDIMKSVNLKNQEVLETLDKMKDIWWKEKEVLQEYYHLNSPEANREDYISEEYREKIMHMGSAHDGYPEKLKGYNLKLSGLHQENNYLHKKGPGGLHISEKFNSLNTELQSLLSTNRNALAAVYPPGGFIGWHNNANASAYNIILTWSENGNGWWKHVDPQSNEVVTVPDVPGWQAKAFYFGAYEDGIENVVYHAASTDCWRMTVSYIFDRHHKEFWEDVMEELEID